MSSVSRAQILEQAFAVLTSGEGDREDAFMIILEEARRLSRAHPAVREFARDSGEDLVQEAICDVMLYWSKADSLLDNDVEHPTAYLAKAIRNACIERLRKERKHHEGRKDLDRPVDDSDDSSSRSGIENLSVEDKGLEAALVQWARESQFIDSDGDCESEQDLYAVFLNRTEQWLLDEIVAHYKRKDVRRKDEHAIKSLFAIARGLETQESVASAAKLKLNTLQKRFSRARQRICDRLMDEEFIASVGLSEQDRENLFRLLGTDLMG